MADSDETILRRQDELSAASRRIAAGCNGALVALSASVVNSGVRRATPFVLCGALENHRRAKSQTVWTVIPRLRGESSTETSLRLRCLTASHFFSAYLFCVNTE